MLSLAPLQLLLAIWFSCQAIPLVWAAKGDSWCGYHMCVNATVAEHYVTYEMTALKDPMGWMSIGFGRHMINTHMVIMWKNKSNSSSLSQRLATHYIEPHRVLYPPRVATVVDKPRIWGLPNYNTIAFRIPVNRTQLPPGMTKERYIWAFSKVRPASSDADEEIHQHYAAGYFDLDLTKDEPDWVPPLPKHVIEHPSTLHDVLQNHPPPPRPTIDVVPSKPQSSPDTSHEFTEPNPVETPASVSDEHAHGPIDLHEKHERLIIIHGALVSFGFLVLLPIGSLTARWGRTLTSHWFKVHWVCNMILGVPIITLGWLLGPLTVANGSATHFLDAHQVCGVFLYALFLAQIYLGRQIQSRPATLAAPAHPPSNILHVALGLLILCLAFFQTHSGMREWEMAIGKPTSPLVQSLWNAWVVILPIAYLVGLIFLPQQFAQERSGASVIPGTYIALSDQDPNIPSPPPSRWSSSHTIFAVSDETREVNVPSRPDHAVPLLQAEELP